MSHYSNYDVCYEHERELIEALQEEFGKDAVEVHKEAVAITGYGRQKQKAHIVVRKKDLFNNAGGDLGFERKKEGGYNLHLDYYGNSGDRIREKMGRLPQTYVEKLIANKAPRGKYRIKHKERGKITLQVLR